jgi:hypothetical protein
MHTLQTHKCFVSLALQSSCIHFSHGFLSHFLYPRQVLVTLSVMFVHCLYPFVKEHILILQFVDSDKYFISLFHRYIGVISFWKNDNCIQYRNDQLTIQRCISAFFKQAPFRLFWFLKQYLFVTFFCTLYNKQACLIHGFEHCSFTYLQKNWCGNPHISCCCSVIYLWLHLHHNTEEAASACLAPSVAT